MFKNTIIISLPLLIFTSNAFASVNDFRGNSESMNAEIKYSKYDIDSFSKEMASLSINAKMSNNFVLGGEVGIFEDNENYFDLSLGYRVHHSRNLYFQGNAGYRKYDFNSDLIEDLDIKYGQVKLTYRYTNGLYFDLGAERFFPNNDDNILGVEKEIGYFVSTQYNFMDNLHLTASYRESFKQLGVGLMWKF